MANLLMGLELDELSLVDRPANAQAMVSLFKRDNSNGDTMENEVETTEKMSDDMLAKLKPYMDKGMSEEDAEKAYNFDMKKADDVETVEEINPLAEEVERLKSENEQLRKGLIEEGYIISADAIEKKAPEEFVEYDGESINKADIPAPILKALEAAELAKADVELTEKANAVLPNFDVATAKELVKSFETNEEVMGVLKAADKAFGTSMEEVGKADVDGEFTSATDKLDALVKSYMDDNEMKKSDYAKAYTAVARTETGKALITKSYKGE
tara:strand:+ start:4574 stop:5383 length:810 start_codon:yes stop_codon:yes gene_type:complete